METVPYDKDEAGIKSRKNIKCFGNADGKDLTQFISFCDQPPKFNKFNSTEVDDEEETENTQAYVYRKTGFDEDVKPQNIDSSVYIPPSLRSVRTTIKVINIPLDIRDSLTFAKTLENNLSVYPRNTFIVLDPENKESRGYAYVTFDSLEAAKEAIKKIDGYAIESNLLGAELAKKRSDR